MRALYQKLKIKFKYNLPYLIVCLLLLVFLIVYLWHSIFIVIRTGEAGVLYKLFAGETVTERIYHEGLQTIYPWNSMHIYNIRVQAFDHEFTVLTKNGLKITLNISVRHHPEHDLLGVLHKKVGPDYVNTIIIPKIESVLRVQIGLLDAEEVYTTKRAVIEKTLNTAVEKIAQRYVKVDDVMIKRMQLPKNVEEQVQVKIQEKHRADAYKFKLVREEKEAARKKIEAEGLNEYNKILGSSLTEEVLQWLGIRATLKLAESNNSKVVVIGSGKEGLPIIGAISMEQSGISGSHRPAINLNPQPETPKEDTLKTEKTEAVENLPSPSR